MNKKDLRSALMMPMKNKSIIGWMVVQGIGQFIFICGFVGIMFAVGPMQFLIKFPFETPFGNAVLDFILFLVMCIIGGAVIYISGAIINYLSGFYKE
jgi:hypothetical protein